MKQYSGREGSRILVVDDDSQIRSLMGAIFSRSLDASTVEAKDNDEAFRLLVERPVDLICTDLARYGEGGEALCKIVRSNPAMDGIPIIVVSGSVTDEIELRLYRLGVDGVFPKPCNVSELLKRVTRLIPGRVDPDSALLSVGAESESLDYKQSLRLSDRKSRASFAKDVLAMTNSNGGDIVVGVSEISPGQFKRVGISAEEASELETTKLNDAIRHYVGQAVSVQSRIIERAGLKFAIVTIPPGELALVYHDQPEAGLFKGRIYIRTAAARSEEVQDPALLQRMLARSSKTKA